MHWRGDRLVLGKIPKESLTKELIENRLKYDPSLGVFIWKENNPENKEFRAEHLVGKPAGTPDKDGYITIMLYGTIYKAHRLAFFYSRGFWPKGQIDHINGIKTDNRADNLRDVTNMENTHNQRTAKISNKATGLLGVTKRNGKYQAKIGVAGAVKYLGVYGTPEEAHQAYLTAKRREHSTCTI